MFYEKGVALKNEDMLLNDYCTDANCKLYNPEIGNKYLQMPNAYVNDSYCTMMINNQDKNECETVYKSYYESVEKFINYYVKGTSNNFVILGMTLVEPLIIQLFAK